ncbi:MAG TPA: hypothetical protein EYP88_08640, partial [Anaerolineales bacterium]|nr:hypothetical protein [Anaerolineales bacterium]
MVAESTLMRFKSGSERAGAGTPSILLFLEINGKSLSRLLFLTQPLFLTRCQSIESMLDYTHTWPVQSKAKKILWKLSEKEKRMRIGMLADAYKPYVSGVTNVIDLTKQYLESAGHDVYVFTFGDEDYQDDEPNIIRSPGLPLKVSGFYFNVRYSHRARQLLYSMDIVHVHHPFLSGRLATWHCKPRGIPIVFTNHTRYDLYAQAYLPILPDGAGDVFMKTFIPGFCNSINRVIAPSEGVKKVLERVGVVNQIDVVPNGVDLSRFQVSIDPIPRQELGFN